MQRLISYYLLIVLFLVANGILLALFWQDIMKLYEKDQSKKHFEIAVESNESVSPLINEPSAKYSVYLTSDDGPVYGSKYLNKIIEEQKVPMTLFLVGARVHTLASKSPNIVAYRENRYLLLANHSYSHAYSRYKKYYNNSEKVVNDFLKNEYHLNLDSMIGRLPGRNVWAANSVYAGRSSTALESAKILEKEFSYKIYGWDYEIKHNRQGTVLSSAKKSYKTIKSLLRNQKTYMPNNIVVLMHDQVFSVKKSREFFVQLVLLLKDDEECELKFMNKYPSIG